MAEKTNANIGFEKELWDAAEHIFYVPDKCTLESYCK